MKRVCKIILYVILALLVLSLVACSSTPPVSETIADNAVNTVVAVGKSLSAECKTEAVTTQLTVVKSEIRSITSACQAEKDVITQEKLRWKWSFWALVLVIAAYVARKIIK